MKIVIMLLRRVMHEEGLESFQRQPVIIVL
jgi:hypothetical protein